MSVDEEKAVAAEIANHLGETESKPFSQIVSIVRRCGVEFARTLFEETLEIEARGGMMTRTGERRRTPGGVFFFLARQRMPFDIREEIFFPWHAEAKRQASLESQYPPFDWNARTQCLQDVLSHKGEVSEVKIHLEGRPGPLDRRQNLVVFSMQADFAENLVLPNGVPQPAPTPVTYVVYVSSRQWDRVAEAIKAQDDELLIDGVCAYDAETGGMAVFTAQITTRKLRKQNDKKAPRSIDRTHARQKAPGLSSQKRPAHHEPPPSPASVIPLEVDLPDDLPDDVLQKLGDLYAAVATFREKITTISAKPADQRFGLEMTQKLLRSTEKQIDELRKQYADKA